MSEPTEVADEMNQQLELQDGLRKMPKAPNRKKFDEEVEALSAQIRGKEAELAKLKVSQAKAAEGVTGPDLPTIRAEKEDNIAKRKKIDADLQCLNKEITKKMPELTKVQSNLPYKKEEKINDAIRKLEQQLRLNNFKLSEEKKIVAEIDYLKRSKKELEQYTAVKKEVDAMRDRQRQMREKRDLYYKTVTALKQKEDEMKRKAQAGRVQANGIKKEIDVLYEEKRRLVADFKAQEKEYQAVRDEARRKQRLEEKRKKDSEMEAHWQTYQQELAEYEAACEPYEEERTLCATLISYLQPYLANSDTSSPPPSLEHQSDSTDSLGSSRELEAEGMYLLKKKGDDNLFDGVVRAKANKRSKREKRKPTNKPVTHTPEIFAQFAQLQLTAPSTVSEVTSSIEQLLAKKMEYECLASLSQPHISVNCDAACAASIGTPSCTESGITSMPSTPEVQLDSTAPQFPTRDARRRRLSGDAGFEDHSSSDELLTDDSSSARNRLPSESDTLTLTDSMANCGLDVPCIQTCDTNAELQQPRSTCDVIISTS